MEGRAAKSLVGSSAQSDRSPTWADRSRTGEISEKLKKKQKQKEDDLLKKQKESMLILCRERYLKSIDS